EYQDALRDVAKLAIDHGIAIPAFQSAISYFDSYRSERLSANLIQAQRDYFGAHTYERVDREGKFHTEWTNEGNEAKSSTTGFKSNIVLYVLWLFLRTNLMISGRQDARQTNGTSILFS